MSTNGVIRGVSFSQTVLKPSGTAGDQANYQDDEEHFRKDGKTRRIATRAVPGANTTFWIDLMREGKEDGKKYVALIEKSNKSKQYSRLFMGSEDMPEFLRHLRAAKHNLPPTSHDPYAGFDSKTFTTRTFYFNMLDVSARSSAHGRKIQVTQVSNIDGEKPSQQIQARVFIHMTELDELLQAMELVISQAGKNTDFPEQIGQKWDYVVKDSHNITTARFPTSDAFYIVNLRREKGGKCFVNITTQITRGSNRNNRVFINIGPEDMAELIKYLKKAGSKGMDNALSGTEKFFSAEFDSKVFKNTFVFSTTDNGNVLKLTKQHPLVHGFPSVMWIPMADIDKLVVAIEKVLAVGKAYIG